MLLLKKKIIFLKGNDDFSVILNLFTVPSNSILEVSSLSTLTTKISLYRICPVVMSQIIFKQAC